MSLLHTLALAGGARENRSNDVLFKKRFDHDPENSLLQFRLNMGTSAFCPVGRLRTQSGAGN
jgi:hypothetical protein